MVHDRVFFAIPVRKSRRVPKILQAIIIKTVIILKISNIEYNHCPRSITVYGIITIVRL